MVLEKLKLSKTEIKYKRNYDKVMREKQKTENRKKK
jgi:hypothetical protein